MEMSKLKFKLVILLALFLPLTIFGSMVMIGMNNTVQMDIDANPFFMTTEMTISHMIWFFTVMLLISVVVLAPEISEYLTAKSKLGKWISTTVKRK